MSRARRLANHAVLALGMGVLSWLFVLHDSTGVAKALGLAAAGASLVVGVGFAVRFVSILNSESSGSIPAEPSSSSRGTARHWTENGLIAWAALCIAALTTEAMTGGSEEPWRVTGAVGNLVIVGVLAMQAVRLVRAERGAAADTP